MGGTEEPSLQTLVFQLRLAPNPRALQPKDQRVDSSGYVAFSEPIPLSILRMFGYQNLLS